MKAAVIDQRGDPPQYAKIPEPVVINDNELLIFVKAAAIKHIDKSTASDRHYNTEHKQQKATVIGGDRVGILADGARVFIEKL